MKLPELSWEAKARMRLEKCRRDAERRFFVFEMQERNKQKPKKAITELDERIAKYLNP